MKKNGQLIVISAPSGCGKSTLIGKIYDDPDLALDFSVSCTSRLPRPGEVDGRDYYFITDEEFRRRIAANEFIEWEEVYAGTCYGTLKSEVERVAEAGKNLLLDIDVKGGVNVKKMYGPQAITVFVQPPSLQELERRLRSRGTDDEQSIRKRLDKAEYELQFAPQYDHQIVNDNLDEAAARLRETILSRLENR